MLILFFKTAFSDVLEDVTLKILSWGRLPDPHFLPSSLLCQCKVFVARIHDNCATSFQHILCSSMACFVPWMSKACKPTFPKNLMIFCLCYLGSKAKFTEWIFVVNLTWNLCTLVRPCHIALEIAQARTHTCKSNCVCDWSHAQIGVL